MNNSYDVYATLIVCTMILLVSIVVAVAVNYYNYVNTQCSFYEDECKRLKKEIENLKKAD